jgi:hypothetical protein
MSELAGELARRYETLKSERQNWITAWDSVAEAFSPYGYRPGQARDIATRQAILNDKILETCGVQATRTLAAGMQGGMTSPARPWFRLRFQGEETNDQMGGGWLQDVEDRMQNIFHKSNLYNALHVLYLDMGLYGTGVMVETADANGLYFRVLEPGSYVLDVNAKDEVDTLMFSRWLTLRQLAQEYGKATLPESMRMQLEQKGGATAQNLYEVVQCIYPRKDAVPGSKVKTQMPWASVHLLMQGGNRAPEVVRESGFQSFPAFAPRWELRDGNVYGYSPAMQAMADNRMLQAMQRTSIKSWHRMSDPALSVNAELQKVGIDLTPGACNYVSWSGTGQPVAATPIIQADAASMQAVEQAKLLIRQQIEQAMYTDLFRMLLDNDRRQITATEIEAKQQEKLILIGPVVERLDKELLSPLIERTFQLMGEWDYLPEAPQDMAGQTLRVEFVSVLAQAQKMIGTSSTDQIMAFAANMAGAMPEILDNFDPDSLIKTYAENLGAPQSIFRDEKARDAMRQQRAQAQAQAQAQAEAAASMQTMEGAAAAAKNLGQAPTGPDGETALSALIGGLGGL